MAGRYWREAATLIIVGRSQNSIRNLKNQKNCSANQDYNILSLKRSLGSSFMPEAIVFPGGKLDKADTNPKWINLFKERGYTQNDLQKLFRFPSNSDVELYSNKGEDSLFPELALRICALRETFEETGLLLGAENGEGSFSSVFPLDKEDTNKWRNLVNEDPSEFFNLFTHIKSLPSVQNLYEWSVWLTPTFYGNINNRFDTAFYITFIDSDINASEYDQREVESLQISGPESLLNSYNKKELLLKPPQLYELSRMAKYSKMYKLKDFTEKRSSNGFVRFLPVLIKCNDGLVLLFTGDEKYPKSPNYFEEQDLQIEQTVEEFRKSSYNIHRLEVGNKNVDKLFMKNTPAEKGHLIPISYDELIVE